MTDRGVVTSTDSDIYLDAVCSVPRVYSDDDLTVQDDRPQLELASVARCLRKGTELLVIIVHDSVL